jgi:hypothetical protein
MAQLSMSRRELLQVGAVGLSGLTLPRLLQAAGTGQRRREKHCILIFLYGGLSQLDSFDLKPDAPVEIRGPYESIPTAVPGIRICEKLPRLARLADRYAVIRSMHLEKDWFHGNAVHINLGGKMVGEARDNSPHYGAVLSKVRPSHGMVSYVWLIEDRAENDIPHARIVSGGRLGALYAPLMIGSSTQHPAKKDFRVNYFSPAEGINAERLHSRDELLRDLEPPTDSVNGSSARLDRYRKQAIELVAGERGRQAFAIDMEKESLRDRYGWHPMGQSLLLARRLIEAGVRLVGVNGWPATDLNGGTTQLFDGHGVLYQSTASASMWGENAYGLGRYLPRVDESLSALLEDLRDRGLLDDTLVVLATEFGRTPRISNKGRDHWHHCYSILMAGAGIAGGAIYGRTDKHAAYIVDDPVSTLDFGATIYHALGVSPETPLETDNPNSKIAEGQPVLRLFT